jgi:hypothetical protein
MFWRASGYDVYILHSSEVLHFTEEEKRAYDEALAQHELTMQVYGMARGAGLRG